MKLATIMHRQEPRIAVILDSEAALLRADLPDMVALIEAGESGLAAAREAAASGERIALDERQLRAPIGRFRRDVFCTGWNYHAHFDEGVGLRGPQEVERPTAPTFFTKGPTAMIGPRDDIAFDPNISACWDYEGEIVAVIGKRCRSITAAEGAAAVFGYCLANDISQRDLQRRHGGQWLKGKSIDETSPFGPFIVTADEVDLPNVQLETFVNGDRRQSAYGRQMAFGIGELIAELSFGMTLCPGDMLLTGTPAGIGMARTPPEYLAEGDEVVIRATGLGELRNRLVRKDLSAGLQIKS